MEGAQASESVGVMMDNSGWAEGVIDLQDSHARATRALDSEGNVPDIKDCLKHAVQFRECDGCHACKTDPDFVYDDKGNHFPIGNATGRRILIERLERRLAASREKRYALEEQAAALADEAVELCLQLQPLYDDEIKELETEHKAKIDALKEARARV